MMFVVFTCGLFIGAALGIAVIALLSADGEDDDDQKY